MKKYISIMHTFILSLFILLTSCFSKTHDAESGNNNNMQTAAGNEKSITINLKSVARNLTSPIGMAVANDGNNRLFVIEQQGKIRIIRNDILIEEPFLDITQKIDHLNFAYSEKGLLGLAFHPQYKTNGRFFVYYSAPSQNKLSDHKSVIAEYHVSKNNADVADVADKIILEFEEPESNHNGGNLVFGKDGYLYIGVGDGGGAGDRHGDNGNGQDKSTYLGKILRIDIDSNLPYKVPDDNPFAHQNNVRGEIYAFGLRNPWRFSFDRLTGRLFCGDVGQNKFEEIDIIEKGKNYGWRIMEATHCFEPESGCDRTGLTLPIFEYPHSVGNSITGGYVYRGKNIPALNGLYIYGDWSGKLFALQQNNNAWTNFKLMVPNKKSNDISAKINSFGEDESGELYVITQKMFGPKSNTGVVYRIEK